MLKLLRSILLFFFDICFLLLCVITGRVDGKETRKRKITTLPMQNLPLLATMEIIRTMSHVEQIKLALTSPEMEALVQYARIKVEKFKVVFNDQRSNIEFGSDPILLLYSGPQSQDIIGPQNLEINMRKWLSLEKVNERIQNIFKIPSVEVLVTFPCEGLGGSLFLANCLERCSNLTINGTEVMEEDFRFILETADRNMTVEIKDVKVPEGFQMENALKFHKFTCDNAHWISLQNIYSIRNLSTITIGKNNFHNSDINEIIKFWIDQDEDMFQLLKVDLLEAHVLDKIFEGVVVLYSKREAYSFYYVASKSESTKKRPILCCFLYVGGIRMTTWSAKGNAVLNDGTTVVIEREEKVLKVLKKKDDLEKSLAMENLEDREEKLVEWENNEEELLELKVRFSNGFAVIYD